MTETQRTLGQQLVDLRDTMLTRFREAETDDLVVLSAQIHALKELVDTVLKQHDVCFDLIRQGEMGSDKRDVTTAPDEDFVPGTINRIRQVRSDKKPRKAAKDFSNLNF